MVEFFVPHKLAGLNDYTRANRANRYMAANMKASTEELIMHYVPAGAEVHNYPVKVHFTWHEKTRRRDVDNVAFAKKFVLDALVKKGTLAGDSPQYVVGFTDNIVYDGTQGVQVVIQEL